LEPFDADFRGPENNQLFRPWVARFFREFRVFSQEWLIVFLVTSGVMYVLSALSLLETVVAIAGVSWLVLRVSWVSRLLRRFSTACAFVYSPSSIWPEK
jgi:hypothetical protein